MVPDVVRVAAVDCGTNSTRLLIADVGADGAVQELARVMVITRLGLGVDATGLLDEGAMAKTFGVLREYADACGDYGVTRVRVVATSATRDARNAADFREGALVAMGVAPEVIPGALEARLSFAGATAALRRLPSDAAPTPWLVVDIGGGSTEYCAGDATGVARALSVNMGCVRLSERCGLDREDVVRPTTESRLRDIVRGELVQVAATVGLGSVETVIGVAGTVTTLGAMALGLGAYDRALVDGLEVPVDEVSRLTRWLLDAPRAVRLAHPLLPPGRADVLAAGAVILEESLLAAGVAAVRVSEADILDGIVADLAADA